MSIVVLRKSKFPMFVIGHRNIASLKIMKSKEGILKLYIAWEFYGSASKGKFKCYSIQIIEDTFDFSITEVARELIDYGEKMEESMEEIFPELCSK